jgi:hypothetical protein
MNDPFLNVVMAHPPAERWLAEHADHYRGLWVALDDDRLVAYGDEQIAVLARARHAGSVAPFVFRVPDEAYEP